jgi:hypothetical protein
VLSPGISYPKNKRYTLQWLVLPSPPGILNIFPNNNDAAFENHRIAKPSDLLLHYNYGVAVVKQWGRNVKILEKRPGFPRPSKPVPAPMGRKKEKKNHGASIKKRAEATRQEGQGTSKKRKTRNSTRAQDADSEALPSWDADDTVMAYSANPKVAQQRRAWKEKKQKERMEEV